MGQKVNPHGLRVGVNKEWDSVWYAEKGFGDILVEDHKIRKFIKKKLYLAGVSKITIARTSSRVRVTVHTAKPGIVIGRSGQAIAELVAEVQKFIADPKQKAVVNVEEIKRPEIAAQLVAEDIAKQLENRVTFRRAMKQAMTRAMKFGAKGIKTQTSGRLGGAEIARSETYHEGTIPLQTLRADIEYGFAEADTTYGKLGVKVWVYKGEILPGMTSAPEPAGPVPSRDRDGRRGGRGRGPGPGGDRNNNRGPGPGGASRPRTGGPGGNKGGRS